VTDPSRVDTRPVPPDLQPAKLRYPRQLERTQEPPVVDHDDPRPGVPPRRRRLPTWSSDRDWQA